MGSLPQRRAGRAAAVLASVAALACAGASPPPADVPAADLQPATSPALEPAAQRLAAAPGSRVARFPDRVLVSLSSDALFAPGTALLAPAVAEGFVLETVADVAREQPGVTLTMRGFTDAQGSESFNLTLSEDRAEAVRRWLVGQGVATERVTAEGLGAQQPVAGNDTPEGRHQNRRIEIEMRAPAAEGAAPAPDPASRP